MMHTWCVLLKVNRDTHGALAGLSHLLRLEGPALSIAGTKDKRAVTSQWLSGFKVQPLLIVS
jgi:tRNA(Glu) U13 pseudouridine synthase TruD